MTSLEFFDFWDYVRSIAIAKGVEVWFREHHPPVDAVSFHVRNPQTEMSKAFYISKLDLNNLDEPAKMLTEKLLDMIKEVKE